jgi:phenylacetate-CoA ligase
VGYTEADLATWASVAARSLRAAGVRAGQLLHNAYGYGLFTGGLGVHAGAERLGCTVVPVSGGQTARQVQLICDLQPDAITVTPSYMLAILDEFERQGVDPLTSSLTVGIFGAEPWSEQMRAEVEERAGIHAVDIYGLSEVIGPGVASECVETKDGLHVWEDHFYPEVVDPSSGEPLPDGQYGELVVTSLTKEAMPVIRYRTGDLTRLLPGTARRVRRLERISGRNDDMIILGGSTSSRASSSSCSWRSLRSARTTSSCATAQGTWMSCGSSPRLGSRSPRMSECFWLRRCGRR